MNVDVEGAFSLVAFCGGLSRHIFMWIKSPKEEPFHWGRMLAAGVAAGFTGLMTGSVVVLMGYPTWALVAAGVGGFKGTESMQLIFDILNRRAAARAEP